MERETEDRDTIFPFNKKNFHVDYFMVSPMILPGIPVKLPRHSAISRTHEKFIDISSKK